jgi:hypothetical protein
MTHPEPPAGRETRLATTVLGGGPLAGTVASTDVTPSGGDITSPGVPSDGGATPSAAPKLCRGCREQMPTVCSGCSRKTTSYCRDCLDTRSRSESQHHGADRRRPRPGDLAQAVTAVMRANPVPAFGGITGWTPGRVGVHLPDHTPAAVLTALRRLAATGDAALVGDEPERYRPTH